MDSSSFSAGEKTGLHTPSRPYEQSPLTSNHSKPSQDKELSPASFSKATISMSPLSTSGFSFSKHMTPARLLLCFTAIFGVDFFLFLITGLVDRELISPTVKLLAVICSVTLAMIVPMPAAPDDEDENEVFGGYPDLFAALNNPTGKPETQLNGVDSNNSTAQAIVISTGDDTRKGVLPIIIHKPLNTSGDDHDSAASASSCGSPNFGEYTSSSDCSEPSYSPWSDYFPDSTESKSE